MSRAKIKPRMGRPPGTGEFGKLRHFRLPADADAALDGISASRMDRPDFSTMMREAVADYITKHKGKR